VVKAAQALLTTVLVLLVWASVAHLVAAPLLVPSPSLVAGSAMALLQSGDLAAHIGASLSRLIVGLAIGVPLGALIGCAMGRWMPFDATLGPFVRVFNAIPALALVPFSLLWLGVTEGSRYALLIYTISLAVLLSARQGVRNVPPLRIKAGASLGISGVAAFFRIIVPSCFPAILAGVRTAIGLGVMVIVAAEMLGADSGLGYLIMQARSHFNMGDMLVGVIGLGILSLVLDRLFQFSVEVLLPRWSVERRIR
jgi:ABC-type nitrate/sulfonate/bicarbonate transport system permease component